MSFIRLFHASPDAPAVDIYANGVVVGENLDYKELTEYIRIMPGQYNIKIYPAGQKNNIVLDTLLIVPNSSISTVAVRGTVADLEIQQILEPKMNINRQKAYLRVVHLSPDAPSVDVAFPDGTLLFTTVDYKEVTGYLPVDPGTYTLNVQLTGTKEVVLTVQDVNVGAMRYYTIYVVGLASGDPPLEAVLSLDGNTYLQV